MLGAEIAALEPADSAAEAKVRKRKQLMQQSPVRVTCAGKESSKQQSSSNGKWKITARNADWRKIAESESSTTDLFEWFQ